MNNKRGKKGQVTLFVILAIAIVLLVIGFLFFKGYQQTKQSNLQLQKILPVKQAVEDCLYFNARDAIFIAGLQGGYTEPRRFLETNISRISYWYYEGSSIKPSLSTIEKELSNYINFALPICLGLNIPENFQIQFDKAETKTSIMDKKIFFDVNFPIKTILQDSNITIKRFTTKVDSNLSKIYRIASDITENTLLKPEEVSLTNYLDSGFDLLILPYDSNTIVYNIIDNNSRIYNESYMFMFANKFK